MKASWLSVLVLVGLVFVMYSVSLWTSSREGFEDGTSVMLEEPEKYNDALYASIYKSLWHSQDKLQYEEVSMQDIIFAEWPVATVKVLDLACGVAPHACWFKNLGVEYTGVDTSADMLEQARKDCPASKFQKGDITSASLFAPKTYSHTCLFGFAIYCFPNSKAVFDNAYLWTQPGGFMVVHMVEPDKYDPILDLSTPFAAFSLQKYSFERQTKSEIFFDQFKYTGTFHKKKNEDDATFDEVLTFYDAASSPGKVKYREQKQHWTMPSIERLTEIAKTSGWRFKEKVHLVSCSKEYQYLVYFTK
jgi:ubiquinone/menaquinone biosynthesis C-methylase UbiE